MAHLYRGRRKEGGRRKEIEGAQILLPNVRCHCCQSFGTQDSSPVRATVEVCAGGGGESQEDHVRRSISPYVEPYPLGILDVRRLPRKCQRPRQRHRETQGRDARQTNTFLPKIRVKHTHKKIHTNTHTYKTHTKGRRGKRLANRSLISIVHIELDDIDVFGT